MKRVISVSIGSSKRNKQSTITLDDISYVVERIGTDGSLIKAAKLIWTLSRDPTVGAIGLGGVDLYVFAGNKRFTFKQVSLLELAAMGKKPVVDGSGLKHTLERSVINHLVESSILQLKGTKVLMVCGVDRFGMSQALEEQGANVTYGDLVFGLNINKVLRSWKAVETLGRRTLWFLTWLPIKWLYPTGNKQTENKPRGDEYFEEAEVIAGDWHLIKRYAPYNLTGKVVITNTLREKDIESLWKQGVRMIVTTTPEIDGESFGTNVIEALVTATAGRALSPNEYSTELARLGFKPSILYPPS
jgi:hypothetical protein